MKVLVATGMLLALTSLTSCKKDQTESEVKKIHTEECGDGEKCIYTEFRTYEKNKYISKKMVRRSS